MASDQDWKKRITDPTERRVFEALSDPQWDFRTLRGLASDVGLSEAQVRAILERYPDLVRKPIVPDPKGRELFTLRSRGVSAREIFFGARTVIAKS
jgi:hypothetical protein